MANFIYSQIPFVEDFCKKAAAEGATVNENFVQCAESISRFADAGRLDAAERIMDLVNAGRAAELEQMLNRGECV